MTTRLLLPLATLSISLGIFALAAGSRYYPLLLIVTGGVLLARLCIRPGGPRTPPAAMGREKADPSPHGRFSMPPVEGCSPERLREARDLAARVLDATGPRQHQP
ncbi:hypothetical protein IWX63_001111 [Arthrobacter sp. CAN_A2]|uniref:hypothetical protein n=1 Tax=Arthrobacter sp. CAN_A2 TaxID=2787718 RepID=UPI0018F04727